MRLTWDTDMKIFLEFLVKENVYMVKIKNVKRF